MTTQRASKAGFIAFCLLAVPMLAALALLDPSAGALSTFEICPFHAVTGLNCAGCGSTRAVHELLNGHILQAFAYNPLTTVASPFAVYLIVCWGLFSFRGKGLPLPEFKLPLAVAVIAAVVAFAVLRNIPLDAFKPLAPHTLKNTGEEKPK